MDVYQFPFGGQYVYTTGVGQARHEYRCQIKDFLGPKYPMLTLDVVFIYMFSSLSGVLGRGVPPSPCYRI